MDNQKRKFKLVKLISIVLVGLVLGIFIFTSIKLSSSKKQIDEDPIVQSVSEQEYNQWNIFDNKEIEYSIKYPKDWVLEEKSSSEVYLYSQNKFGLKTTNPDSVAPNIYIRVYNSVSDLPDNTRNLALGDWIKFQGDENNIKKIIIDGIDGYEVLISSSNRMIFFEKENFIYSIFDGSGGNGYIQKKIVDSLDII